MRVRLWLDEQEVSFAAVIFVAVLFQQIHQVMLAIKLLFHQLVHHARLLQNSLRETHGKSVHIVGRAQLLHHGNAFRPTGNVTQTAARQAEQLRERPGHKHVLARQSGFDERARVEVVVRFVH